MTRKKYDWADGPAQLQLHSIAKHKLLRGYLARYFQTLIGNPSQDTLRLTIVDGFAGGGAYFVKDTYQRVPGSPIICLESTLEAEALANLQGHRRKPLTFDVDFVFVEKDKSAVTFLIQELKEKGYGARLGQNIHVIKGEFQGNAQSIIEAVKKKTPRNGRSIFILDQYGYSEVPMPLLASIFSQLPKAEVILTFNVDSFSSYATDKKGRRPLLESIGLPAEIGGRSISDLKLSERNWRAVLQSHLYKHITDAAGASFHTPFFIRSSEGHGDFWLLHLSMHRKARDVMTEVHWSEANTFIHYGGEGLDMFKVGYITEADERFTRQKAMGFQFDDDAHSKSISRLKEELPQFLYRYDEGVSFAELHAVLCNQTPATAHMMKETLFALAEEKEIHIITPAGGSRRAERQIKDDDKLLLSRQGKLTF